MYFFFFLTSFLSYTDISAQTVLEGVWQGKFENDFQSSDVTWKFSEQTYELDLASDGSIEVSGKWEAEGNLLYLWDIGGPMACPETQKGKYSFEISDNSLKLTLVEDDCPGRKMIGPNIVWILKE